VVNSVTQLGFWDPMSGLRIGPVVIEGSGHFDEIIIQRLSFEIKLFIEILPPIITRRIDVVITLNT